MDIRDRRALKNAGAQALAAAPGHKKLVLISAGVAAALSLVVSTLNFVLEGQIAETGGLAGMGMRSALTTVQSLLTLVMNVALPFWSMGYVRAVLHLSRGEAAGADTLLAGFRRFGPVLRLMLLRELLYTLIFFVCLYIGSTLLSFTPLALPVYELLLPVISEGADVTAIDQAALVQAMLPVLIGCAVLGFLVCIPVFYRLRLASYRIMDDDRCGTIAAMGFSNRAMRRNCMALFKLDLSFWWFYLAEAVVAVLGYGDVILTALRIELPVSSNAAYFIFYAAALLAQLLLYVYFKNYVSVTYAKAYDALRQPPETKPAVNTPWSN